MRDKFNKIIRVPKNIVLIEISVIAIIYIYFWRFNIHLFKLSTLDQTSILGTILQSAVTIIAILFSLVIFIGESYLGKYVSSSLKYVINNPPSFALLSIYVIQIVLNIHAIIYNNTIIIDITIGLFILCIGLLLPYYIFMNKLFTPRRLIDEAVKSKNYDGTDDVEIIRLVYQITMNLIKNNEIVDAIYGIEQIVNISTQEKEENKFNAVCIEYLERIAVEGFSFDPVVTEAVIMGYGKLLDHIGTKIGFIVGNYSNYLSSSCNKINALTGAHLYSERSLMMSFQLYNRVYVSKSISGYGAFAPDQFQYIINVIELMKKLNMEDYKIMGGFVVDSAVRKMVKEGKDSEVYRYMEFYIELLPFYPFIIHELCNPILDFPIEKKELGLKIIRKLKEKKGDFKITLIKTEDKNRTTTGGGEMGEFRVETGNEEKIEKVGWFESVFSP